MERNGIIPAYPDDQHVLYRDENPANQDHHLHLWIALLDVLDAYLLHECRAVDIRCRRPAGDKLEQIGKHFRSHEYCAVTAKRKAPGAGEVTSSRYQVPSNKYQVTSTKRGDEDFSFLVLVT